MFSSSVFASEFTDSGYISFTYSLLTQPILSSSVCITYHFPIFANNLIYLFLYTTVVMPKFVPGPFLTFNAVAVTNPVGWYCLIMCHCYAFRAYSYYYYEDK